MTELIAYPPDTIQSAAAWYGPDMAEHPDLWIKRLSAAEIAELARAAQSFLAGGDDIESLTKDAFPLPCLSAYMSELQEKLIDGIGFEGKPLAASRSN